jgi:hypothetical protein
MRRLIHLNLFLLSILFIFTLSFFANSSMASTINVGPGQTYTTIQAGINAANNGDTVLVAPGTYNENINFSGKAITVTSSAGPATTIIDGGQRNPAVSFITSETRASILSGFTIQHGGTYTYPGPAATGGISLQGSSPTILNNILTQNYCWSIQSISSAPLIQGNVISATQDTTGNCSFGGGAGIYASNNLNDSGSSGSTVSPVIISNTIENNVESGLEDAGGNGGAGIAAWGGTPIMMNNIIRNNTTLGTGGAINVEYAGDFVLVQNLIYGNSAGCGGGAIAFAAGESNFTGNALIANNVMVNNISTAGVDDGACAQIAQIYPNSPALANNNPLILLVNNIVSGSTTYPAVDYCSTSDTPSLATQPTFNNNILLNSGGPFFGSYCVDVTQEDNNITLDPQFVNPSTNDFQLQSTSPAIDSGQNSVLQTFNTITGLTWTTDFTGNPRVQDAGKGCIIDMGAYEYTGSVSDCASSNSETLVSSLNPSLVGQSVTFTAQLSASSGTPTGDIEFLDGTTLLSTQTVSSTGSASFTTSALTIGSHTINANYQPTGTFSPSTASLTQIVSATTISTATTISSSLNPAFIQNPITFTATVTASSGTPTGTVNFYDSATLIGTSTLTSGQATFTTSSLTIGAHSIVARFVANSTFAASTSAFVSEYLDDFSLVNISPSTITVLPVSSAGVVFTLTPIGPSSTTPQPITASVTGIPTGVQYSLNPTTIPAGQSTTDLGLSVASPIQASLHREGKDNPTAPLLLSLLLLPFAAIFRHANKKFTKLMLLSLLTLTAAIALTSCGSVLKVETSTVTITATSGALTHSTFFTLAIE